LLRRSEAHRQQHKQRVCKAESSVDGSGSGQDKEGPRCESSSNDGVEQNVEKGSEEDVVERNKDQGKKIEI
jgi:hypothetical protein